MNGQATVTLAAAGAAGGVACLVLGVVILGGGASTASAASGLRAGTVPAPYVPWVLAAGQLCPATVGPAAIAAQIDAESGWNPAAVSPAGAEGIAQFMPATWPQWARDDDGTGKVSPFNPADAIMAEGRYLCALAATMQGYLDAGHVQGDVLDLALAAYNAGLGAVLAAHGVPHNGETDVYVSKIRQLMATYSAPAGGPVSGGGLGAKIVAAAASQIGRPYVWGGGTVTGPTGGGFDCSGLVMYALYQGSGGQIVMAEHLADFQARQGNPVTGPAPGSAIDLAQLQPGDVIGFADPGATRFHHIGIYAGNDQLIHAPDSGSTVTVASLASSYWARQTWQVRRFG